MKKIIPQLIFTLVFAGGLWANPQWENAEYLALGNMTDDASQKVLMYFDGSGNQLGYIRLDTSAYASATSIAFGAGIVPNLDGGDGLLLLRSANDFENTNNYMTVNIYADPITASISNGSNFSRLSPVNYLSFGIASNSKSEYVDVAKQIDRAQNGLVTMLVDRYNRASQELITTYIYKYMVPDTMDKSDMISRVETEFYYPRWDIGGSEMTLVDFSMGVFATTSDPTLTNQFAVLDDKGDVRIYLGSDLNAGVTLANMFSILQDGKEIVSIWGDDNYTLMALYNDNSVLEYDTRTGELKGEAFKMNADYTMLDVVKVGGIVVPEPAEYALAFGIMAVLYAAWRRCR